MQLVLQHIYIFRVHSYNQRKQEQPLRAGDESHYVMALLSRTSRLRQRTQTPPHQFDPVNNLVPFDYKLPAHHFLNFERILFINRFYIRGSCYIFKPNVFYFVGQNNVQSG